MTSEQIKKKLNLEYISTFNEGRAWVEKNGKEGHVDKKGNITTPMIYDRVGNFKEGRAWVATRNFEFYINKEGYPIEHEDFYNLIKGIF